MEQVADTRRCRSETFHKMDTLRCKRRRNAHDADQQRAGNYPKSHAQCTIYQLCGKAHSDKWPKCGKIKTTEFHVVVDPERMSSDLLEFKFRRCEKLLPASAKAKVSYAEVCQRRLNRKYHTSWPCLRAFASYRVCGQPPGRFWKSAGDWHSHSKAVRCRCITISAWRK